MILWLRQWEHRLRRYFDRLSVRQRRIGLIGLGLLMGIACTLLVQSFTSDSGPIPPSSYEPLDGEPDITVTLSPALIGALLRQSIEQSNSSLPLKNIRVGIKDNRLAVRGDVDVLGRNVGGLIEMEPYVQDGQLRMRVRQAQLGPVPVPSNIESLADRPINERLAAAAGNLPATVTSVNVTDAGLTVTARLRTEQLVAPR